MLGYSKDVYGSRHYLFATNAHFVIQPAGKSSVVFLPLCPFFERIHTEGQWWPCYVEVIERALVWQIKFSFPYIFILANRPLLEKEILYLLTIITGVKFVFILVAASISRPLFVSDWYKSLPTSCFQSQSLHLEERRSPPLSWKAVDEFEN